MSGVNTPGRKELLALVDKIRGGTRDGWGYGREECADFIARLAAKPADEGMAHQIIGDIEKRFPDWKSYRDLVDCIDCTLHALRRGR